MELAVFFFCLCSRIVVVIPKDFNLCSPRRYQTLPVQQRHYRTITIAKGEHLGRKRRIRRENLGGRLGSQSWTLGERKVDV